jgi:hypothetical protein
LSEVSAGFVSHISSNKEWQFWWKLLGLLGPEERNCDVNSCALEASGTCYPADPKIRGGCVGRLGLAPVAPRNWTARRREWEATNYVGRSKSRASYVSHCEVSLQDVGCLVKPDAPSKTRVPRLS